MTDKVFIELENTFGARNYNPLPVVLSQGAGVWVFDVNGKKYLDMMSAYSAVSHGHSHPKLVEALTQQVKKLSICSRAFYNDKLGPFLEKLCTLLGYERALIMNSGAEAVETAIKAVRRHGYEVKGIPENKAEIIVCGNNFHGRTTAVISFSTESAYRKNFGPFMPGFKIVPFGDLDALKNAITPHTCAVITEPMQGEAGILIPPKGWLKGVETLCNSNKIVLILDEIQTGLGRTGKLLAAEHENVRPHGVILGKALGGGLLPVSALVGTKELLDVFTPGSHGSTFGGNPLAAAVGLRALEVLEEENLAEQSHKLGRYLLEAIQKIQAPCIRQVRGAGLWVGIDIDPAQKSARKICEELMKRGILTKETHETVIRLAPPLVITHKELDWAIPIIEEVLSLNG
jgi:ornithine--oxo-acid transaminase